MSGLRSNHWGLTMKIMDVRIYCESKELNGLCYRFLTIESEDSLFETATS
jgi:hypothetical protein